MAVVVGEKDGYKIEYWSDRRFHAINSDGDEVGVADSETEAEATIERDQKSRFKFPIEAFYRAGGNWVVINITSMNISDQSVRYTVPGKKRHERGGSHEKIQLRYNHGVLYKVTDHNSAVIKEIQAKIEVRQVVEAQIKDLEGQFEGSIDRDYFNLR